MLKRLLSAFLIIVMPLLQISAAHAKNDEAVFSDVHEDSAFFIPVKFLKQQGLISGYADGSFKPENSVNRAEALAMIFKVANIQVGTSTEKPFRDVYPTKWYFPVVSTAKKLGIVSGYENGQYFRPVRPVNLAETLRILFSSAQTDTNASEKIFPLGIPPDAWYSNDIAYATAKTMLTQLDDGSAFAPWKPLKRGEMALLLYRFIQTQNNVSFGYASWYGDGLAKTNLRTGVEFADRYYTAAHLTLPFGTIIRVTNMQNGKYVDVVVNDRGPYVTGRIVDLSRTAFSSIASAGAGVVPVQMKPVNF